MSDQELLELVEKINASVSTDPRFKTKKSVGITDISPFMVRPADPAEEEDTLEFIANALYKSDAPVRIVYIASKYNREHLGKHHKSDEFLSVFLQDILKVISQLEKLKLREESPNGN